VKVVDFPGHRRLREELVAALPTAGALVFVVDAISIKSDVRHVAQFLYDIFTNQDVNKAALPILIACNKQDVVTASSSTAVQSMIEKELDQLRSTRASTPMQEGTQRGDEIYLGIEGEKFKIEHLPMQVSFVDCSSKDDDLEGVKSWIASSM
jgi:signal recognition particle receptor subunit beta